MPISEEKHEPVSDINTAAADSLKAFDLDSLKALDLEWPIREADMAINAEPWLLAPTIPRGAKNATVRYEH